MRTFFIAAVTTVLCSACAIQETPPDRIAASREQAKQLATELKAALTGAMQSSPESAIAVCNEKAPQIAQSIAKTHDVQIGRTALRVRNPGNEPNDWQRKALLEFQQRAAKGESLATMEYTASVAAPDGVEHRYMKAIPLEPLCATCHGAQIAPSLQQAIKAKYPNDRATGFNVGELRGAVYVVRRSAK